jgi:major vault protein
VHETVVAEVAVTTLSKQQYCVVLNPIDAATKRPRRGARETRRGEMSFFLHPGEELQNGIESALMLGEEEALLLWCDEHFVEELDGEAKERFPGSEWQIEGPRKYFPPTQVGSITACCCCQSSLAFVAKH